MTKYKTGEIRNYLTITGIVQILFFTIAFCIIMLLLPTIDLRNRLSA